MNVWIKFGGWFQCRLSTDPDPTDEPRGVSGYVRAVAGEPDLDRIIRLQPPVVQRSHCPPIGVNVTSVFGDSRCLPNEHPLVGATVELLDDPKFEGRNHVIAEDGYEPVVPVHLRIAGDDFELRRKYSDEMKFPPETDEDRVLLSELAATGVNISPGVIGETTQIWDLGEVWKDRAQKLAADRDASSDEIEIAALSARIAGISDPRNARFFPARMLYRLALAGNGNFKDSGSKLPGKPILSPKVPWPLEFWFGAWDADALSGFMEGYLGVPIELKEKETSVESTVDLAAVISDPLQQRR